MSHSKKLGIVGEKFLKDTLEYRAIPLKKRKAELRQIMKVPRSTDLFQDTFPQFPIQYSWNHGTQTLAAYAWEPKSKPKAVLVNFHALNAHTGLSGVLAQRLAESGIVTTGFDLPNFGKSISVQKERGHIEDMSGIFSLSEQFLMHSAYKYPGLPLFCFGLSMGGLISFETALRRPSVLKGCVLVNPAFEDNPLNNPNLKKLMIVLGLLAPKLRTVKPIRSYSTKCSLESYKKKDEYLYSGRVWPSTTWALLSSMYQSSKRYPEMKTPYLCIQGGTDKILNPFAAFNLEEQSSSVDKETVIIHDMWHAMWFDERRDDVIELTKQWLLKRCE